MSEDAGHWLLVDGNNTVHRGTDVYDTATRPGDRLPIGGLFGVVKFVRNFLAEYPEHTRVIVVTDAGRPAWRSELCPEYKAQRDNDRAKDEKRERVYAYYKAQMPHVRRVANACGFHHAKAKGWEGDDVIAALALRRLHDQPVTIYSTDKDFIELVRPGRVRLYNPTDHEWRDEQPSYLMERLLDPKQSDNLDGVPGIGKTKAEMLVREWRAAHEATTAEDAWLSWDSVKAVRDFVRWCEYVASTPEKQVEKGEQRKLWTAAKKVPPCLDKLVANWKVTCLRRAAKLCDPELLLRWAPPPSKTVFKEMLDEYGLRPLVQDMSAIWPPLANLDTTPLAEPSAAA